MRHISFSLTSDQVRHGFQTGVILKDVTRRLGWRNLKKGERLVACVKCRGLKKGEHPDVLGIIEVVSARREPLGAITRRDVAREGTALIGVRNPKDFIHFFCKANSCPPSTEVTRIEFKYLP